MSADVAKQKPLNWREVADVLAERLAHHAFCNAHSAARPDADCPFCRDRAAYEQYLAAGGTDYQPRPEPGARLVPLAELRTSRTFEWGRGEPS